MAQQNQSVSKAAIQFDREWESLPLADAQQLDELCRRFEQALVRDPEAQVEAFLVDLPGPQKRLLALELAMVELEHRQASGQRPTAAEYARRFPEWADDLRELFAPLLDEPTPEPVTPENFDPEQFAGDETRGFLDRDTIATLTSDEFRKRVTGSGIVSPEEAQRALESLRAAGSPADSCQLAELLVERGLLTTWQVQRILRGESSSLMLGNYVILDTLGQGGMGVVFKAVHTRMKRIVALKMLSPQVTGNPEALRRFEREVEAVAQLNHPNIVTAHDADEAKGTHFLVMEYVEGTDLAKLVREHGPQPVRQAVDCVLQAARGMAYAHDRGVVHRDIKPGNLLLDTTGSIKILDMGLARLMAGNARQDELTGVGQIMGTVDYMAPEQARNTKDADARADIYSLGMTLWFLLTGKPAHTGSSPTEKLLAHQSDPVPSLTTARPDVSEMLDAAFSRMVAKRPEDRFQTMSEVVTALEACQASKSHENGSSYSVSVSGPLVLRPAISSGTGANPTDAISSSQSGLAHEAAMAETVSLVAAELDSDPQSQDSRPPITKAVGAPATVPPRGPWSGNRRAITAIGGAAVLLLFGFIIITITRKDGSKLEVSVPDDVKKVEIGESDTPKVELGSPAPNIKTQHEKIDSPSSRIWPKDAPPPAIAPFNAAQATQHQQAWADYLKLPVEYTNCVGMKFRLIPPGEFLMGVEPGEIDLIQRYFQREYERPGMEGEASQATPKHRVRITRPYYLQTHEVTFALFQQILGRLPAGAESEKLDSAAINYISLSDAVAFCDELSKREEKSAAHHVDGAKLSRNLDADGYRLPTEAEWEFACRAGTTTVWFFGDDPHGDGEDISSILKEYQTGWHGSAAKANPFGLFDMYVGSDELCFDRYLPYRSEDLVDPFTDPGDGRVVTRGGTEFAGAGGTTSVNNSFSRRETLNSSHGFSGFGRVLLPIPLPPATPVGPLTESPLVE